MEVMLNPKKSLELNTRIVEFLNLVFPNKRDALCAKIILSSLPFEIFGGGQKRVLQAIQEQEDPIHSGRKLENPSRHYWDTIKKLRQIGMIVEAQNWNREATRKIRWYDKGDSFVKFLNSVSSSWGRFCRNEQ